MGDGWGGAGESQKYIPNNRLEMPKSEREILITLTNYRIRCLGLVMLLVLLFIQASIETQAITNTYQSSTVIELLTLNTHLAGDELFIPSWNDAERADDIADFLNNATLRPDVVGFQEIWDEDLFFGSDDANGILPRSAYPFGDHGDEEGFVLNSGAALMSLHPMNDFRQVEFLEEGGFPENAAAKGWVETTISKDGFSIGILNTHTNADNTEARSSQIEQLMQRIETYRTENPSHVVFAIGDFNVYGESLEYETQLLPLVENLDGKDAARSNMEFFSDVTAQWTLSDANPLATHFDEATISGRLDYIFYFSSLDGQISVAPSAVAVLQFTGRNISEAGLTTNQSSDHWAVHGTFLLTRQM